jgi:PAS domain S-box-containing protein
MPELIYLFKNRASLLLPNGLIGWFGWLFFLAILIYLLWRWRDFRSTWSKSSRWILLILFLLVPLTSLFIPGIRLPISGVLSPTNLPEESVSPVLMALAALPWFLGAGLLGIFPATILASVSGLILALWDTHNPFLPLEMAFLAILLSAAIHQNYRTQFYRLLRHPFISGFLLSFVYLVLFLVDSMFLIQGNLTNRLDYAITYAGIFTVIFGFGLLIAGVFSEVIALALPGIWGSRGNLRPSPAERRLSARFLYGMAPLALLLLVILVASDWIVAGNAARQMLEGRMANAALTASQNIPSLLLTGEELIVQLAQDPLLEDNSHQFIYQQLSRDMRLIPYFNELILLDVNGDLIAAYPNDIDAIGLTNAERSGIKYAFEGIPFQIFSIPPDADQTTAGVSFMTMRKDNNGQPAGILIGRSYLASNTFAIPLLTSLNSLDNIQGEGILLDDSQNILYHPNQSLIMTLYSGPTGDEPLFYDDTAPDGTRQLVYYQPVLGRQWGIVLKVPAHYAQQMALNIAAPLLGMIVLLSLVALILIRLSVRSVTASLDALTYDADRMAHGQLDKSLPVDGEDEVGQLRRTFEQMRISLKARLDELNRLLLVSQGVASTLEIEGSLKLVLESALLTGATSARVVLVPNVVPELDGNAHAFSRFGIGPATDRYAYLDDQVLALARQQDRLLLTNLARPRLLIFPPGQDRPQSILAVALRHENLYYGSLWVAYDQVRQFSDEEVSFLVTLAGQAALAAANTRLFLTAEIGRQRLEAILTSSPDPVLVTDHQDRILLANPAAWQVFGLGVESGKGQPIDQVISQSALVDLMRSSIDDKRSVEIKLPDGRIYLAIASSIIADDLRVGRVCVLRDVTHFKELDALKSEFVSTVSHDLRSPLTLIRGYATMLQMVGDLNEQQSGYVNKIVTGVENMSRLVNNLLDLGRIEAGVGLQLEMVPVQDLVERIVSALQLQAAQKHLQLVTEFPAEPLPLIEADQALLQQAIHNLVENAIKYTETGQIKVKLRLKENQIIFEVHDTGIGIAPADQQRLFEKFYRVGKKGARRDGGSGLGLAIVKSVVERHGGKVWLESQLGRGSTFYMSIPRVQVVHKPT